MLENQIHREYVRTDSWSISARISKDESFESSSEVRIPNIAAGGALVSTEAAFEQGDEAWIDMKIDPVTPGISRSIPMKVKVLIRDNRGAKGEMHTYAVEFTNISKNDRTRLDELVHRTNYKYMLDSTSDALDY